MYVCNQIVDKDISNDRSWSPKIVEPVALPPISRESSGDVYFIRLIGINMYPPPPLPHFHACGCGGRVIALERYGSDILRGSTGQ